jgi:hypothetical protein
LPDALLKSLSLLDPSGYVIITIIVALLATSVAATLGIRARYAGLERELRRHGGLGVDFQSRVLNRIAREAQTAAGAGGREINTQAIIDHCFQSELKTLLIGERYVKASTGLFIILGLVGTFYGLTLSIGRLVALVSGDTGNTADVTQSLMTGLTQALSGMSVAFSCSLFGIVSAIVMTFIGVFFNVADRRTAVMVQIEAYLDNELLPRARISGPTHPQQRAGLVAGAEVEQTVAVFSAAVAQLEAAVLHFESALQGFSANTRDFQEFNLHLKDNVQRMSLAFADLSDTLQQRVGVLKTRE